MILNNVRKMYASYGKPNNDSSLIPVPINGIVPNEVSYINISNYDSAQSPLNSLQNSWRLSAQNSNDLRYTLHDLPLSTTQPNCGSDITNYKFYSNVGYSYKNRYLHSCLINFYNMATKTIKTIAENYTDPDNYRLSCSFIDVGFDDTPEDLDDYKLADSNALKATPVLTHVSGENNSFISGGGTILDISSAYINNGASDVTVKEIGIVFKPTVNSKITQNSCYALKYASWEVCNFLITRKVLDEPVVMHPGDSYRFTYKVKV